MCLRVHILVGEFFVLSSCPSLHPHHLYSWPCQPRSTWVFLPFFIGPIRSMSTFIHRKWVSHSVLLLKSVYNSSTFPGSEFFLHSFRSRLYHSLFTLVSTLQRVRFPSLMVITFALLTASAVPPLVVGKTLVRSTRCSHFSLSALLLHTFRWWVSRSLTAHACTHLILVDG